MNAMLNRALFVIGVLAAVKLLKQIPGIGPIADKVL